jgi:hypothetical protein
MNSKLLLALCAVSLAVVPACKKDNGKGKKDKKEVMKKDMKKNGKHKAK